ncbi:MAG: Holliday junction branch migration protein RuvA [Eubacterium sp.]|nr:Holliday junction branch migration protein RuvA [Eubacterium sp.]
MIGYVKGTIESVHEGFVLLENNGIGYEIFVPASELERMPHAGEEVRLYTYLHVREDAMQLYGFLTRDACDFFKLLITVSGVGPKAALSILSTLDVDALRFAILAEDSKSIAKSPGIGKKTAEKIVLELRDKCDADDYLSSDVSLVSQSTTSTADTSSAAKDAIEALVALGYSSSDAMRAVKSVVALSPDLDTESILKNALKTI